MATVTRRRKPRVIDVSDDDIVEPPRSASLSGALVKYLLAALLYGLLFALVCVKNYDMPTPLGLDAPESEFSEARAKQHVHHMAKTIGKSWAGTKANADVAQYLRLEFVALQQHSDAKRASNPLIPRVEVDVQTVSGAMEFDILGGYMTNVFSNLTNVVARMTFGAGDGDAPALLLNSHFDSPLESDGAMDARGPVATIVEVARALLNSDDGTLRAMHARNVAVIFLLNGGEEILQMASHGFITQHPWAKNVRTVVNMDAAGNKGPEVLFQNGGLRWVKAYQRSVPFPHGEMDARLNVLLINNPNLLDTDYRIFVKHGNVSGLDLAFYRGSYSYHTTLDTYERMQDGSLQHEGSNVLAYARYVLSSELLLSDEEPVPAVYFEVLQTVFFSYSRWFAALLHVAIAALVALVLRRRFYNVHVGRIVALFVGVVLTPTLLGVLLYLFAPLMWFARPILLLPLFGFPTLTFLTSFVVWHEAPRRHKPQVSFERSLFAEQTVLYACFAMLLTLLGVGSAYTSAFLALSYAIALCIDQGVSFSQHDELPLGVYLLPMGVTLLFIVPMVVGPLELLAPLFGRLGDVPADAVMGGVIGLFGFAHGLLCVAPLVARWQHARFLRTLFGALSVLTVLGMMLSLRSQPYTSERPKRVFLQHAMRMTPSIDGDSVLDSGPKIFLALCDSGPSVGLLDDIMSNARALPASSVLRRNAQLPLLSADRVDDAFAPWTEPLDFDGIYPFNYFLNGFVLDADAFPFVAPTLEMESRHYDPATDTTTRRMAVSFVGYEMVTLRFKTTLVAWDVLEELPHKDRGWFVCRLVAGRTGSKQKIQFSITSKGSEQIHFQMAVVRFTHNDYFKEVLSLFPHYSTLVGFTSVYGSFLFK